MTRARDVLPGDPLVCASAGGTVTVSKGNKAWVLYEDKRTAETVLPAGPSPETRIDVERLWCRLVQRDVLLVYEARLVDDKGDFVRGVVARLDESGKPKWVQVLAGNVGEPYAVGGSLYVSGLGFVGKLDMQTGAYLWKHAELYRSPGMFNSFEAPRFEGHQVVFKARHANFGKPPPASWPEAIVIDDNSGAILAGRVAGPP
jgi:hypothetical protein